MLSVKQAAERLGVSAKLVYALCARGKIAHERHGLGRGTIRITEEALEECRE
jgi:excisionase family DNA binding protein